MNNKIFKEGSSCIWTYMVIPCVLLVVDDRGPKAPCRVDAGAGDRDGGQVNEEDCKTNW